MKLTDVLSRKGKRNRKVGRLEAVVLQGLNVIDHTDTV